VAGRSGQSPTTSRAARRPIELGHPGFRLLPVVIDFEDLPRITDLAHAQRLPELAVLSAMAHPELDVAATAIDAIAELPEEQNRLYLDTIMAELPDLIRQLLETRMQGYQYRSEFARRYYNQGREEGHKQGHEEGLRNAVLALARTRLEVVTAADQAMIEAVHDEHALTELIDALARAQSPSEARAACELVVSRFRTT
jgi:flagellar biosynthesis/type III secretory pathway protein FliH